MERDENELVFYVVVNKTLSMSPGKISSQTAHATINYMRSLPNQSASDQEKFNAWYDKPKRVVLTWAGKQKEIEKLFDKGFYYTQDAGISEVPTGSITCLVLGVMSRNEAKPFIKRLQIFKKEEK